MSARRAALPPTDPHAPSWYAATADLAVPTAPLAAATECDVCVVGGGLTGVAAALHLARGGREVVLLEQALLGWGASGRNGGQVHVGMRRTPDWLESRYGTAKAEELWRYALAARVHLDWLMGDCRIDCEYRAGLLHADHKARYADATRRHVEHLRTHYRYPHVRFVEREELRALIATDGYFGASFDTRGGHLHPLKLVLGMARLAQSHGARLHERTLVESVARSGAAFEVRTAAGAVRARSVVLAGDGYLRGIAPEVESRVMPINNFVAVTEPLGAAAARALIANDAAVADSRFVVNYYRTTSDHRLLFGGGETYSYRYPRDIAAFVRPYIERTFPQLARTRIDYAWGGAVSITPVRMPLVRELEPGLYNASGYSGLGVLLAPYTGKVVADAIAGERGPFELLAGIPVPRFPGGRLLRWPTLVAAMSYYALRDRL